MLSCDRVNDGTKTLPNRLVSWRRLLPAAWWIIDFASPFAATERALSGQGLRSIDKRVRLAGGTVSVQPQPGRGAPLFVRIPMATTSIEMAGESRPTPA